MSRKVITYKHDQLRDAIKKADKMAAKQLILNNALAVNLNRKSTSHTLLHWAIIKFEDTEIIELLIDQKIDFRAKNHRYQTPLDLAVQRSKVKATKLLLKKGAHQDEDLDILIYHATVNGNDKIVKLLIDYGVENGLSMNLNKSLNPAIEKGCVKILKYIISYCKFKNRYKMRIPKDIISKAGLHYNECIKILFQHGFSIPPSCSKDNSFIYSSVKNGYYPIVKELCLQGINVNMKNRKTGLSLLHVASLNRHVKIAELLLIHGADVNSIVIKGVSSPSDKLLIKKITTLVGKTALHIAVSNLDVKMTKLLLDYGAIIKNDPNFLTLTSIAIENESKAIVELFLKEGIDINAVDSKGRTPLHFCTERKRSFMTTWESRPSRFNYSSKHEIAELLLKKGADINVQTRKGNTPLITAIENNYLKMVETLLKYNPDVNRKNNDKDTALHVATSDYWIDLKIISLLLDHNANVNAVNDYGVTPLQSACRRFKQKIIWMLLSRNADVTPADEQGMTSLHYAAEGFDASIIEMLLENGAIVDAKNNMGKTALHYACEKHLKLASERVKSLLKYNADINAVDADGKTPLFYACKEGDISIVKLLLVNKADVNHVDSYGATPVLIAAQYSSKVAKFLINRKSTNIYRKTNSGKSLLHILAEYNRLDVVEKYIDRIKSNINSIDKCGKTALHYAAVEGHKEMIVCLLKNGADINISTLRLPTVLFYASANILLLGQEFSRYLLSPNRYYNRDYSSDALPSSYWRRIDSYKKVMDVLREHVIKLKCAGLNVNKQNMVFVYGGINNESFDDELSINSCNFESLCTQEIDLLKTIQIEKGYITLYDILSKNIHTVARYIRNSNVNEFMESTTYHQQFPLYADIIKNRYIEAVKRSELTEFIKHFTLQNIFEKLPHNCVDDIISYLTTDEIGTFIQAVKVLEILEKKNIEINKCLK